MSARAGWPASLAATLVLALLGGCSDDDGGTPSYSPLRPGESTEDATPSERERVEQRVGDRFMEGLGYWYVAPEGWRDATRKFRRAQELIDTAAQVRGAERNDLSTSVGVWTSPAIGALARPLPQLGRVFARQLSTYAVGVRRAPGRHRIDGEPAILLQGQARFGRRPSSFDQYVVANGTQVYVITFSFLDTMSAGEQESTIRRLLRSWHWTT